MARHSRVPVYLALVGCAAVAALASNDTAAPAGAPAEDGWFMSGRGKAEYTAVPDQVDGGRTAILLESDPPPPKYGTWMRSVDATDYIGKRVRVSALVRTQGADGRADFWARVQAPNSPLDGTGMTGKFMDLPENQPLERKEIVLDVPQGAKSIQCGVGLAGPGKLWVAEPKLEVVAPN